MPDREQRGSTKRSSIRLPGLNLPLMLASGGTGGIVTYLCLGGLTSITTTVTTQGYY